MNGNQSGIGLPHSTTLARRIACHSFPRGHGVRQPYALSSLPTVHGCSYGLSPNRVANGPDCAILVQAGWNKNQELLKGMKRRTPSHFSVDSRLSIFTATCAIFALLTVPSLGAQDKSIDPRADELLKRMGDFLAHSKFFSVNAEIWQDIALASGQQIQAGRSLKLQLRRPNRLHSELTSPRRNHELIYDGSSITLFNRAQNFYGTIPAPGTLDEAMDLASDKFGIAMPLEDFIGSDPHKDLCRELFPGPTSVR